jgi:hypothetical protein
LTRPLPASTLDAMLGKVVMVALGAVVLAWLSIEGRSFLRRKEWLPALAVGVVCAIDVGLCVLVLTR